MGYILSADFGTSSLKLSVLDFDLQALEAQRIEYSYDVRRGVEVDISPEKILWAFAEGMKLLEKYRKSIDVIICDTLCPSLIPMDREGKHLYPAILHLDRRSEKQARWALKKAGKEMFLRINGNLPFPGGISLTSILWLKENHPDIYRKAFQFGHFNTYLQKFLVNRFLMDPTHASFTGLYETLQQRGWSSELCKELGIDREKLPDIVRPYEQTGELTRKAARFLGLKAGTPVLMGANDTATAAFGAGAIERGQILNISGSNEIITITLDKPLPHEKVYLRAHVIEGRWLVLAITIGGGALEWFRREFYREIPRDIFFGEYFPQFVERLRKPRAKFLPYLAGDRHSIAQRRASLTNLTLDTTREECLAALLFGIFEPINLALRLYGERVELEKDIVLTGGMVNEAFLQLKKKLFPQFTFRYIKDCVNLGNGKLVLLNRGR